MLLSCYTAQVSCSMPQVSAPQNVLCFSAFAVTSTPECAAARQPPLVSPKTKQKKAVTHNEEPDVENTAGL